MQPATGLRSQEDWLLCIFAAGASLYICLMADIQRDTEMRPDIASRLSKAMNAGEVRAVLLAACGEYGQVVRTGVVCSADEPPPRRITGIVVMAGQVARLVAKELGVANLGKRLVVFRYAAPAGFQISRALSTRTHPRSAAFASSMLDQGDTDGALR